MVRLLDFEERIDFDGTTGKLASALHPGGIQRLAKNWRKAMTTKVLECALELRRGSCTVPPGRVMRVARLLALALKFERLLGHGAIADYAYLARLGQVSRARITQIMNLVYLAPDIQEEILFAPRTVRGRDAIHLGRLQPIALVLDWRRQRLLWRKLLGRLNGTSRS